jgi:hypothetical protein
VAGYRTSIIGMPGKRLAAMVTQPIWRARQGSLSAHAVRASRMPGSIPPNPAIEPASSFTCRRPDPPYRDGYPTHVAATKPGAIRLELLFPPGLKADATAIKTNHVPTDHAGQ